MNAGAALLSVVLVGAVSLLAAGVVAIGRKLISEVTRPLVAFAVGALLCDVFIHLLPESYARGAVQAALAVLIGVGASFVLERVIRARAARRPLGSATVSPLAVINLAGDAIHNFVDGVVIAASYAVSFEVGFATTVAVALHELPQEMGDFGVLLSSGLGMKRSVLWNAAVSLGAVVGALVTIAIGEFSSVVTTWLAPVAAGNLLYLAAADLMPDLHERSRPRQLWWQVLLMAAGVAVMLALRD